MMTDKKDDKERLESLLASYLYNGACHISQAAAQVSDARCASNFNAFVTQIEGSIELAQNDLDAAKRILDALKGREQQ